MNTYSLTDKQVIELSVAHRKAREKWAADRIKAVYLLGKNWRITDVCTALMLSENTVRHYYTVYQQEGLNGLLTTNYVNERSYLNEDEIKQLEEHLMQVVYLRVEAIITYVKKTYRISYRVTGMTDLLHRLGFVYKKPKRVPDGVSPQEQRRFVRKYLKIQRELGPEDAIYFMDATHPHYQTVAGYGWIKKGQEKYLPMTLQQQPLNINGAINLATLNSIFQFEEKHLTKEHTLDFLEALRKQQPKGWIYLICDRSGCYYSEDVKAYAKSMAIKLIYLPRRSPNLNIIERLWQFLRNHVLCNQCYSSYEEFSQRCKDFLNNLDDYELELRTLLTDNFQILGM